MAGWPSPFNKTDQQGKGAVSYLGPPTLRRLRDWGSVSEQSGAVFCRVRRGGHVTDQALTPDSIRKIIRAMAAALGITVRVSGHSPQVGSAQNLVSQGATLAEVQLAGRWQSSPYGGALCARRAMARLRYGC